MYTRHEQTLKNAAFFYCIKKAQSQDVFGQISVVFLRLSSSVVKTEIHSFLRAVNGTTSSLSPDVQHYRFSFFIGVFFFSHTVIHKLSVTSGEGSPPPTCLLTSWLIYLDQAKAQMCLVKRQLRVNHDFKGNPRPLPNCGNLREVWQWDVPTAHTHITCSLWSSCWAAGRTTAAAACEPPPLTATPAGTPRRIWRCAPAPSWRAASACPDTCPGPPAGTAPISRCGRTWREDICGTLKGALSKCWMIMVLLSAALMRWSS